MSSPQAFLRLLEGAAAAADQSVNLEEAVRRVLPEVSVLTGWPAGRLSVPGEPDGQVFGGAAAYRVPVRLGDEEVASLVFCVDGTTAPDQDLVDLLAQVGRQLARVEERVRAEKRYRALAGSVRDAVLTTDHAGTITEANGAATELLRYPADELIGMPVGAVLVGLRIDGQGGVVEVDALRWDGMKVPVEVTVADGPALIVRESASSSADELHDPLTGLANHVLLRDRLDHALARSGRAGSSAAVVAVDLDRFKVVNDSYGPSAGDALLVAVASRLEGAFRSGDTVGRVGGNEFAVVCEDVDGEAEARTLVTRLLDSFLEPFSVAGRSLAITPTVGIALAPAGADAEQLLRDADVARERARQRGRGQIAIYDESMRVDASEKLSVEHDLRAAIHHGQLRLHYQPIVDVDTRSVVGAEALVRWQHPTRGLLHPQDFIGLAEDSGLIVPLGRWVLEQACRQGALWQSHPGPGMRVSVNVSARQFQQEEWAEDVATVLASSGLPPDRLVLEITESMLMDDIETTKIRLAQLRKLGVRIAIDDFGTGYSSLGYLRHLPVDILKVDKSFIDGVAQGPHESALARAVIKLAATLNLDAVAEGVRSHRQYAQLRRLRCGFAQGNFFSPPLPPDGLGPLITGAALDPEG